jgi:membrane glycosyltransferase
MLAMTFAPKLASALQVLLHPAERRRFGGPLRFLGNLLLETLFTCLLGPIMVVTETIFLLGHALGQSIGWTAQARDDHAVPLADAARRLWLQTLCGVVALVLFAEISAAAALWSAPLLIGLLLAVPFASLSALPGLGLVCARLGVGGLPEENQAPAALLPLHLPALAARGLPAVGAPVKVLP